MTQVIATEHFDAKVLKADRPVLVDFYAEWCGPCKALSPVLDQLATDYDGRVEIVKVDIDASPDTAAQFKVRGVPTLALFENGQVVDTLVGAQPKAVLSTLLEKHIS